MIASCIAHQPIAEDYRAFQRHWWEASAPLVTHLGNLLGFGRPCMKINSDGSVELLEPIYPEWVVEPIAEMDLMLENLRDSLARHYGLIPAVSPERE